MRQSQLGLLVAEFLGATTTGYRWDLDDAVASAADYLIAIGENTEMRFYGQLASEATM